MVARRVFTITDTITVLRGEKNAEPRYRQAVSARIIQQFGTGPYPPNVQKEVFTFCQQYFIEEFEKTCERETSFTFYREIFTLHEQATDLRRSDHYLDHVLAGRSYRISSYHTRLHWSRLKAPMHRAKYNGDHLNRLTLEKRCSPEIFLPKIHLWKP